jgi:hypothetical protein
VQIRDLRPTATPFLYVALAEREDDRMALELA